MDLRHLRYFVAVATERSFTRAAERLHISQPPLSKQIRELEAELKVVLFDRESRPVRLTEAGRLLFEQAHKVLGAASTLTDTIERYRAGARRRFVIGFVGSTIYDRVPEAIRRFRQAEPELEVDLVEMNTLNQLTALKDGGIDVGIGRLSFEDPQISRRVIEHERLVAALPKNHPLAQRDGPVSLADLASDVLILYPSAPRPSYADQVLGIFSDYDLRPTACREVRELQTALGLVSAEAGVAVVPTTIQRVRRDDIHYRDIVEEGAISPIILSWRTGDTSGALDIFLKISDGPMMLADKLVA